METCYQAQVRSGPGQVWSRLDLVQVWFRLQLKFNSIELESEVGRLVILRVLILNGHITAKSVSSMQSTYPKNQQDQEHLQKTTHLKFDLVLTCHCQ